MPQFPTMVCQMNILVIGNGGREHSICWAISQNPKCKNIYCVPGSDGISEVAKSIDIDTSNSTLIIEFCKAKHIDLVVIGPEGPLEKGLSDQLNSARILTFGPSKNAAKLESSKVFTKNVCKSFNGPTARYEEFDNINAAKKFLKNTTFPTVIKRDGLAEGKGVTIVENYEKATEALKKIFYHNSRKEKVLIEEHLSGEEASLFIISDGVDYLSLGSAQDHKRLLDNDEGPNTGGMGAYSPAPILTKAIEKKAIKHIIKPTIDEMGKRGKPFRGILYAGLMICDGLPYLIEYNVRFGDPECQVLMMRLGGQILDVILDCLNGNLKNSKVNWANDHALTIVLTAKGYPNEYTLGDNIPNLSKIKEHTDLKIFHAGTKKISGLYYSNGGRVLNVTTRGVNLKEAQGSAYRTVSKINWKGGFYRQDIGDKGIRD